MSFTIAIIGRPNVGKSTLFNRLVGQKLALVDDLPGVTRDRREGEARLGDLDFTIIDTAGLDEGAKGSLTARMQEQTETAIAQADALFFVIDARVGLTPTDRAFADFARRANKPVLLVANKSEGKHGDAGAMEAFALGLGDPIQISAEHGEGMGELYDALARLMPEPVDEDETEDEARYREAACLLADIGWRAHPEYRGMQSLNIIAHASFIGVDHPGRAFIALANLFRHEGVFDDSVAPEMRTLATPRYLERARLLGALLRVVYLLSASMPGVIPKLRWQAQPNGGLALVIPASHAGLDGERPRGRLAQLAKVTGRSLELVVG